MCLAICVTVNPFILMAMFACLLWSTCSDALLTRHGWPDAFSVASWLAISSGQPQQAPQLLLGTRVFITWDHVFPYTPLCHLKDISKFTHQEHLRSFINKCEVLYQWSTKVAEINYPEKYSHYKNKVINFKQLSQLIIIGNIFLLLFKGVSW